MQKIDFILTWVDGDDEIWQKARAQYNPNFTGSSAVHYRDYGTLKYWFRAVEAYAPWVNKIHFVTCGQHPKWLNLEHPKLSVVDHVDFIPEQYLPTFSINPIELNFHRIPDLAEQFVYFNDDTFLCAPVKEIDFFRDGLPCDSFALSALAPSSKNEVITYILFNNLLLLNANKNKREALKANWKKWLSLQYGTDILRNLYYLPIGKFTGFVDPHLPNAFLKSTYLDVWGREEDYLNEVCNNKFRTKDDVNQYLMRYWQLADGKFAPRNKKIGHCYVLGKDNENIVHALESARLKLICINDDPASEDFESQVIWLNDLLENMFPNKSEYEN